MVTPDSFLHEGSEQLLLIKVTGEFECFDIGFAVVFYRPVNHINVQDEREITEGVTDRSISDGSSTINITNSITEKITNNITESITLNESQKEILAQMLKDRKITAKKLAEILGIAERNVKNHIKVLKQAGLIEREGSAKGGYWVVKGEHDNG